jgi:biopolymer transport protein ExbD
MKIKRNDVQENVGFNMTPMIDIVFQLIIFFMLATDFSQMDLEDVTLPLAKNAESDEKPDKERLMINLCHNPDLEAPCPKWSKDDIAMRKCVDSKHWVFRIRGKNLEMKELVRKLKAEGDISRDPATKLSERPAMIRADQFAPYEGIERIMMACSQAGIYKLEIGAAQPPSN